MFGAMEFGYKRTGSVSEVGHTSVTMLTLVLQYWWSQTDTTIQYKYVHVNSMSVDRWVGIANLMATLEAWVPNILKDKSMKKRRHVLNSFPGLGCKKTNCLSLKLKVFMKAVINIEKEILNMHVKSIISLCSSVASVLLGYHA